jgi:antitoxin component YwqK of YwqJK toxin-antitoxin module
VFSCLSGKIQNSTLEIEILEMEVKKHHYFPLDKAIHNPLYWLDSCLKPSFFIFTFFKETTMQNRRYFLFILLLILSLSSAGALYYPPNNPDTTVITKGKKTIIKIKLNGHLKEVIRMKNGEKHGFQEKYNGNGGLAEKTGYKKGHRHGVYERYDYYGKLAEKKTWKYDKQKGQSVLQGSYETYNNGTLEREGSYKDNVLHGEYKEFYNGRLILHTNYEMGLIKGEQKKFARNSGAIVAIEHYSIVKKDGKPYSVKDGAAKYFDNQGNLRTSGQFKEGLKTGEWVEYFYGGKGIDNRMTYKEGKKHGEYVYYYPDGKIKKRGIMYDELEVNGVKKRYISDGTIEEYYQDGQIKSQQDYDKGELSGDWIRWYQNGQVQEKGNYTRHMKTGKWQYWDDKGSLISEMNFKIITENNKDISAKHGTEKRWKDGVLVSEVEYVDGKKEGKQKQYYANGQLASVMYFNDGGLQGDYIQYYENGSIKSKKQFINSYPHKNSTSKKSREAGWRMDFDTLGNPLLKMYMDTLGNRKAWISYDKDKYRKLNYTETMDVYYFPNGKVMSVLLGRSLNQPLIALYYYLDGSLRKISFQNPETFVVNHADFASDGELINTYSDMHQNPDSLRAGYEIANLYATSIGRTFIPNKLYSDKVRNGLYTLTYANGAAMAQMEFKDDLPHGKFVVYDAVSGDTLVYRNYEMGSMKGEYIEKFAGKTVVNKGYSLDGNRYKYKELYRPNGTPVSRFKENEKGERIYNAEFYENGQMKLEDDKEKGTYTHYSPSGFITSQTINNGDTRISKSYWESTGQLRSSDSYKDNKRHGIIEQYYESGQLQYRHHYKEGKREGEYVYYMNDGSLRFKGMFVNDKQEGEWLVGEKGKIDTVYYLNGKVIVKAPTKSCACIDTTQSSSKIGFANSLSGMIEFKKFMTYVPDYIKVDHDEINYKSIFMLRTNYGSGYSNYNSMSSDLVLYRSCAISVPADKQVRIDFNPCRMHGYIARMQTYVTYGKDISQTSVSLEPKRISLELIKGPLKSADPDYEFVTAYFNTKVVEYSYQNALRLKLENDPDPCFTKGIVKDFLTIEMNNGEPFIFDNPMNSRISGGIATLGLSNKELQNFFGVLSRDANLSFEHFENNTGNRISSKSSIIMAGGEFVAGQFRISCSKTGTDTFKYGNKENSFEFSSQTLKVEWLKRGFTRMKVWYDEDEKALIVNFFAE